MVKCRGCKHCKSYNLKGDVDVCVNVCTYTVSYPLVIDPMVEKDCSDFEEE